MFIKDYLKSRFLTGSELSMLLKQPKRFCERRMKLDLDPGQVLLLDAYLNSQRFDFIKTKLILPADCRSWQAMRRGEVARAVQYIAKERAIHLGFDEADADRRFDVELFKGPKGSTKWQNLRLFVPTP